MTPASHDADGAVRSDASADHSIEAGREGDFRVRLTFVGNDVRLDRNHDPIVDPRARFHVFPRGEGVPVDIVPAYSRLVRVQWRRAARDTDSVRVGDRDRRGERKHTLPSFGSAWIDDETATRDHGRVFAPGFHQLVLQAPPRAGGGTVTVVFFSGFAPSSVWFAGPDPAQFPLLSDGGRGADVTDWNGLITEPLWPPDGRGYFAPDSFLHVPTKRRPVGGNFDRRTFYEIFENRIYARNEGDAVHVGSWVVFVNGGFDRDSPYVPLVEAGDPALPPGFPGNPSEYPALLPQGLIGSPIGFRFRAILRLPSGHLVLPPLSQTYPNFMPSSVSRMPQMAGYWFAREAGRAYVHVRAVDSHGLLSPPIDHPAALADLVDAGGGTPEQRLARRAILTFWVGPPPGAAAQAGGIGEGLNARLRR